MPSAFDNPLHKESGFGFAHMERIKELLLQHRDEAAELYRRKYDKGHVAMEFEEGDYVWWREHEPGALEKRRTGPWKVVEKLSAINYRLEEVPGKTNMGRRHPVTHVQHIEAFTEPVGPVPEQAVERIMRHKLPRKPGQSIKYRVAWSDDTETWEKKENLIDPPEKEGRTRSSTRRWNGTG